MPLQVEFDVDDLVKAFKKAEANLSKNMPGALKLGAELVAEYAILNHDYTDVTKVLTTSIVAGEVEGTFEEGDLEVAVTAGAPYALFVEEDTTEHWIGPKHRKALAWGVEGGMAFSKGHKHPGTTGTHFLANAAEAMEPQIADIMEDSAALSFQQAGFEVD